MNIRILKFTFFVLGRYGPHELCLNHVRLLMDIYIKSVRSKAARRLYCLESVIRRLFAFLCPEDMMTIKQAYSLATDQDNLHLWKLIRFATMSCNIFHFVVICFLVSVILSAFSIYVILAGLGAPARPNYEKGLSLRKSFFFTAAKQ